MGQEASGSWSVLLLLRSIPSHAASHPVSPPDQGEWAIDAQERGRAAEQTSATS